MEIVSLLLLLSSSSSLQCVVVVVVVDNNYFAARASAGRCNFVIFRKWLQLQEKYAGAE